MQFYVEFYLNILLTVVDDMRQWNVTGRLAFLLS